MRRIRPVAPPLDAQVIPAPARAEALAALADLTAAAAWLGNPDLFHRPRFRTKVRTRPLDPSEDEQFTRRIAEAAEERAAAGLMAVEAVRHERYERPGRRPCFDPGSLAQLHRMIAHADPNIPGGGGLRRADATVTWDDGRTFRIDVAAGRDLRAQVDRWYHWGTRTTSPALDAAALSALRLFTIHPFPDANGRVVRLLAQCDLVGAGLMPGLLLDLEAWTHSRRYEHDEAIVAAADGAWSVWGAVFARAVTDTARHRIAVIDMYRRQLEATITSMAGDDLAADVLGCFRSTPAVSASWLRSGTSPYTIVCRRLPHQSSPAAGRAHPPWSDRGARRPMAGNLELLTE